jgi:hypothetical protein
MKRDVQNSTLSTVHFRGEYWNALFFVYPQIGEKIISAETALHLILAMLRRGGNAVTAPVWGVVAGCIGK